MLSLLILRDPKFKVIGLVHVFSNLQKTFVKLIYFWILDLQIWNLTLSGGSDRNTNNIGNDDDNNNLDLLIWNLTLRSSRIKPKVFPAPQTSGQKIRLRGGKAPFSGIYRLLPTKRR